MKNRLTILLAIFEILTLVLIFNRSGFVYFAMLFIFNIFLIAVVVLIEKYLKKPNIDEIFEEINSNKSNLGMENENNFNTAQKMILKIKSFFDKPKFYSFICLLGNLIFWVSIEAFDFALLISVIISFLLGIFISDNLKNNYKNEIITKSEDINEFLSLNFGIIENYYNRFIKNINSAKCIMTAYIVLLIFCLVIYKMILT